MKHYSVILFILFFTSSCSAKSFISTSKKVESECIQNASKWKGKTFHDIRSKLYNMKKFIFIENNHDTLYFLESYEAEGGSYIGRIWNNKGMIDYRYNRGILVLIKGKDYKLYDWSYSKMGYSANQNGGKTERKSIA